MTTNELNRDIKRLYKAIEQIRKISELPNHTSKEYFDFIEDYAKREFKRLYNSDNAFEYMNKESIKIMLRLNIRHRFEQLHMFGIFINY